MKTNRKDGILVLSTKKPYKMSVNGAFAERNQIICHEITSEEEYIAYDVEHMIDTALFDMQEKYSEEKTPAKLPKNKENDIDYKEFFENISPDEKEVDKISTSIELIFRMNTKIKMSSLAQVFSGIVFSGLVCKDGNTPMTPSVWKTVDRDDKLRIMFHYICFFLNPFEKLLIMGLLPENQEESEATSETELPFE